MNSKNTTKTAKVRIITKSEMRYEGELFQLNPKEKTICLKQVTSFGTEDRLSENKVMGVDTIFECVVFQSKEIKDLVVLKKEITKTQDKVLLLKENEEEKEEEEEEEKEEDKKKETKEKEKKIQEKKEEKFDLQALRTQTEDSKLHNEKTEAKRKQEETKTDYLKDDFFDKITTSTRKYGRGTDRNYLQMQTNEETFGMTKKEIQESIKEHRKFKYRGKKRGRNRGGKRGGKRGKRGRKQDNRDYYENYPKYRRKDEEENNKNEYKEDRYKEHKRGRKRDKRQRGNYRSNKDDEWESGYKPKNSCLLYTSPSPRDLSTSRMPSSA